MGRERVRDHRATNRGRGRNTRKRLGRVVLSYGIVFLIGLWVGYKFASTRRATTYERGDPLHSIADGEDVAERKGDDEAQEGSSVEGEPGSKDELSLTFYEELLKKEPPPSMQEKRGETRGAVGPEKRDRPPREEGPSGRAPGEPRGDASFCIQVGAFAQKKQADDLTQRLKGKGYPAYIRSLVISGKGRIYRVRIGRYRTRDEAERQAKYIGEREGLETYVPLVPDR
jgi:hypothetical protein